MRDLLRDGTQFIISFCSFGSAQMTSKCLGVSFKIRIILLWIGFGTSVAVGQELPASEVQINLNGYFDNFRVNIIYPSVSLTKQVGESTSLTGRYLVDVITAASIKSLFRVDGVTSATSNTEGDNEGGFDEVRNEVGVGVTQLLHKATLSVNGLYSTEHDYVSKTLALGVSYPFAKKNTTVQLGYVRSWDRVSPQTRPWEKTKDAFSVSAGLTQVLSKRMVAQLDASYSQNDGFLSDAYQVVTLIQNDQVRTFEPVHPDHRERKAIGLRVNYKLGRPSSLQLGYRYYWDNWDVRSHTVNALYQRRLSSGIVIGMGVRGYVQSRAFFFEPTYAQPQSFMTVDSKLDEGYTTELQFHARFDAGNLGQVPVLGMLVQEGSEFTTRFNLYFRHTATPNWHSRFNNLYAYLISFGYRYKL